MRYSKVMCLVRGDETDTEVVETAVSHLAGNNRSVRFVYVILVDRRRAIDDPDVDEFQYAEQALRDAERFSGLRGDARGVILQARSIAPVLIREALDYGADAIVAGVKIASSMGQAEIDPDADHLLTNAPCAVVLVRPSATGFSGASELAQGKPLRG